MIIVLRRPFSLQALDFSKSAFWLIRPWVQKNIWLKIVKIMRTILRHFYRVWRGSYDDILMIDLWFYCRRFYATKSTVRSWNNWPTTETDWVRSEAGSWCGWRAGSSFAVKRSWRNWRSSCAPDDIPSPSIRSNDFKKLYDMDKGNIRLTRYVHQLLDLNVRLIRQKCTVLI